MSNKLYARVSRLEAPFYAVLRVVSGLLFAMHGTQKFFGWPAASHGVMKVGSQLWLGGIIELVCGLLIAIGLLTRPAAFLAAGTMAVAYLQFHWQGATEGWKWLPMVNKGELAVVYCFVFLYIFARGAGIASVDSRLERRA